MTRSILKAVHSYVFSHSVSTAEGLIFILILNWLRRCILKYFSGFSLLKIFKAVDIKFNLNTKYH